MTNLKFILILLATICLISCQSRQPKIESTANLTTHFEGHPNQTVTYDQGMAYWQLLKEQFPEVQLVEFGRSDIGKPLHWVIVTENGIQNLDHLKQSNKATLLVNNAIHAGEPCGVDASMMFIRDVLLDNKDLLDAVNIVVIPFYNIGGVLHRNSTTRTNQNGPESYGFRGNAKNLDLNRDFIKADSKNAYWFAQGFSQIDPDVFMDNHTTNGADYQHHMTLISSLPEHYEAPLRGLFADELVPYLYEEMVRQENPMVPYVYSLGQTPFEGIRQFNDLPRYSMGYASLHNTLAFTPEAHMLKTYEERVTATYQLLHIMVAWMADHSQELQTARAEANATVQTKKDYVLQWELDTTAVKEIGFLGYSPKYKESDVTGESRLYYDHESPTNAPIPFYYQHQEKLSITKPKAYIIPQAYDGVIERLKSHGVEVEVLQDDEQREVKAYRIVNYSTGGQAYENHYLHRNVEVESFYITKNFYTGDVLVPMTQEKQKIILECLEPQGEDSFFAWNFFDGILQQKEYFSPYVFEDEAADLLMQHPEWKEELEQKKNDDPEFAENTWAQLYFIYQKSNHYEASHNVYPVYRVE